mgnify:CR=1 FL=1
MLLEYELASFGMDSVEAVELLCAFYEISFPNERKMYASTQHEGKSGDVTIDSSSIQTPIVGLIT